MTVNDKSAVNAKSAQAESETCSERERRDTPRTPFEEIAEKFSLKTKRAGEDLTSEWKLAFKGMERADIEKILIAAKPGIQWPSEFKAHRAQQGSY